LITWHATLDRFRFVAAPGPDGNEPVFLFTENETNVARLFNQTGSGPAKDAFHDYVIHGRSDAVNARGQGTKSAAYYALEVPAGGSITLRFRLFAEKEAPVDPLGPDFDRIFAQRQAEADEFYTALIPSTLSVEERQVVRQASAGLLWSKQFYHY